MSKHQYCNHSDLRIVATSAPNKLDTHISNLEAWGLIKNSPPISTGHERKIELIVPYEYCLDKLTELKDAINYVNHCFSHSTTNQVDI